MTGRITEGMLSRQLLTDLRASTGRIASAQRDLASGVRLHNPSDDPLAAHSALRLRGELEGLISDQSSVSDAKGWVEATDIALGSLTEVVHRARELALQASNGTMSEADRKATAAEVNQLISMVKAAANATYGGRYVMAGSDTDAPPYAMGASDLYAGNDDAIARSIGPGVSLTINVTADTVLGEGDFNDPADTGLLASLRKLAYDLENPAGAPADLGSADIRRLDENLRAITSMRGNVGALANRIEAAGLRLRQSEEATTSLLSEAEDTDVAKALIDLTTQQSVYQAALRSGSALVQPSLLDFLR